MGFILGGNLVSRFHVSQVLPSGFGQKAMLF